MTGNEWNECPVCGEQITTKLRIHGFAGWETSDGEIVDKQTAIALHPACYMRTSLEERDRLLIQRSGVYLASDENH